MCDGRREEKQKFERQMSGMGNMSKLLNVMKKKWKLIWQA